MNLHVLLDNWMEGVIQCVIKMIVVQNQRMSSEDLNKKRDYKSVRVDEKEK